MIQIVHNRKTSGQTALVLILLTAAALIFLAITLNWGRIAQEKTTMSIAADQAAALLASDVASYGEMNKKNYLQNTNKLTEMGGYLMAIIMVVVAIIVLICSCGAAGPLAAFLIVMAVAAVVMAVVNLVLQITVVQPGITAMWNKLQQNQPILQQFYEGGIGTAIQGVVADQVNITDYYDWNGNGVYGNNTVGSPADTINRFAIFYTDRLKMLNGTIPVSQQVEFFYDQLGELIGGVTCGQEQSDSYNYGVPIDTGCTSAGVEPFNETATGAECTATTCPCSAATSTSAATCTTSGLINCVTNSGDPVCQIKVPGKFQLNDACIQSSDPTQPAYNPYCDPCCQPLEIQTNPGKSPPAFKTMRPSSCSLPSPLPAECIPPTKSTPNPSYDPYALNCLPPGGECVTNNPYGPSKPFIYDQTYQNYADQVSFLAQYGRDQQMMPAATPDLPLTTITPEYEMPASPYAGPPVMQFPNGIYTFFWEMNNYSPRVDNINPNTVTSQQQHWCTSSVASGYSAPAGYQALTQLGTSNTPYQLSYSCSGEDCCINYLADNVTASGNATSQLKFTAGAVNFKVTIKVTGPHKTFKGTDIVQTGSSAALDTVATEKGGTFIDQAIVNNGYGTNVSEDKTSHAASASSPYSYTYSFSLPSNATAGANALYGQVEDLYGLTQISPVLNIIITNPPTISFSDPCSGSTCYKGNAINISATASETGGVVSRITIDQGANSVASCTNTGSSNTCSGSWTPTSAGTYGFTAKVTDNYGYTASTTLSESISAPQTASVGTNFKIANAATSTTIENTGLAAPIVPAPAAVATPVVSTVNCNGSSSYIIATSGGYTIPNNGNVPDGVTIFITPCFSSSVTNISGVLLYDGGTLLETSSTPPYTYTLTVPTTGSHTYNIYADAIYANGSMNATRTTTNGTIDMVGDLTLPNLSYSGNPASDPVFGDPSMDSTNRQWLAGDNQFCSASWPYNALSSAFPDGQCEWNDTAKTVTGHCTSDGSVCSDSTACPNNGTCSDASNTMPAILKNTSTVDQLDNTMHTLSDFLVFSNSILSKNVWQLSGSLSSWYPNAATWIGIECGSTASGVTGPSLTGTDPTKNGAACSLDTTASNYDPDCDITTGTSNPGAACNPGSSGRLLSIYNRDSVPVLDVFNSWNTVISQWLNNSYSPSGSLSYAPLNSTATTVWCIPDRTSLLNGNASTNEDTYINTSGGRCPNNGMCSTSGSCPNGSACAPWGQLPQITACMDYNAGQNTSWTSTETSGFNNCLAALTQMNGAGTCQAGVGNSYLPDVCQPSALGTPPNASAGPAPTFNGAAHGCDPSYARTFANWVSNSINFGPVYNYQQCVRSLLSSTCAHDYPVSGGPPPLCAPSILGRSLVGNNNHQPPAFDGCAGVSNNTYTYVDWATDSLTLAQNEQPKFALRSAYLKDIYSNAQTMSTIFTQGHNELKAFFCEPNDAGCPSAGGPAYQLREARTEKFTPSYLPNAVIYGWTDKNLPNGHVLANGMGYAHIVKVTAYSPGRNGNPSLASNADVAWFVQTQLPWIKTQSGVSSRSYTLIDRDGYVYVSVRRWDQDHVSPVSFANNHPLWQFAFKNPTMPVTASEDMSGLPSECVGGNGLAYGLMPQTIQSLTPPTLNLTSGDLSAMENSFMLNDEGNGMVDTNYQVTDPTTHKIIPQTTCGGGRSIPYCDCLRKANEKLGLGVESHACAEYIASGPSDPTSVSSGSSQDGDADYSIKFVDCKSLFGANNPPSDMTGSD